MQAKYSHHLFLFFVFSTLWVTIIAETVIIAVNSECYVMSKSLDIEQLISKFKKNISYKILFVSMDVSWSVFLDSKISDVSFFLKSDAWFITAKIEK